ncbi:8f35d4f8-01fd-4390-8148-ec7d8e8709b3-CDS [Sclerotinia trifoliorum]|uniref:8f35d4f8-01fd-4390-8148-ec7d8e8709b3-CDS n=1 Tax=Sclerotinia trifoliorum TaxID=28548 RepID=A0A8H2VWE0_9HELO|nr:8f35d4f8-01fd-4390-8148-ec7d8e8709b3-CDS [Sclerotinia trifoliorum]
MPPQSSAEQHPPPETQPNTPNPKAPSPAPEPKRKPEEKETEAQKLARHQARHERRTERERERGLNNRVGHETGSEIEEWRRRGRARLGEDKYWKDGKEEKRGILRISRQSIGRGIMALGQRVAGDGNGSGGGGGSGSGSGRGVVGKGILYSKGDEKGIEKGGRNDGYVGDEPRRRRRRRRSTVGERTDGKERDRVSGEKLARYDYQESDIRVSKPRNNHKEKETRDSTPPLDKTPAKSVPSPSPSPAVREPESTNPKRLAKEVEKPRLLEAKNLHIAKRAREEREKAQQETNKKALRVQALEASRVKKGNEENDRAAKEKLALQKEKEQKDNHHQKSTPKAKEEYPAHLKKLELQTQHQAIAHRIERQKEEAYKARLAQQKAALLQVETIRLEKIRREKEQEQEQEREREREKEISQKKEEERLAQEKQRRIEAQRHLENQRRALELEKVRRELEREKEKEQARQKAETERLALEKQRAKAQVIKAEAEKAARLKAEEDIKQQERLHKQAEAEAAKLYPARIRTNVPANHTSAAIKAAALLAQQQAQVQNQNQTQKQIQVQVQKPDAHPSNNKKAAPLSPLLPPQPQNKAAPAKLTRKNLILYLSPQLPPQSQSQPQSQPKKHIGDMERTILEGYVPMNLEEIRAREIERGERREKKCIGNMERTILEGYVPMSEEEMRMGNKRGGY